MYRVEEGLNMWNVFQAERTACAHILGDIAVSGSEGRKKWRVGQERKELTMRT